MERPTETDVVRRGLETILLVDDEELLRTTTARILEHLGYRVIQAGTADEALHLAGASFFHLLLMDVVLPRISGLSLAHKIAADRPETRILYFSAYASDQILEAQFEKRPGVGFIRKPFTASEMSRAVRAVLDDPLDGPPAPDVAPAGTESILIVDEDPHTRRFMVKSLERLGYHALEAQNAERALNIVGRSNLDLVISDESLHEGDGPSFPGAVSAVKPDLPHLLVSGQAPSGAKRTSTTRPVPILYKPFSATDLGIAVRRLLDLGT